MTVSEDNYVLGHSEEEIRRLQTQAAILRPISERLLRRAGIQSGMRVLDLGTGAGDLAMLAAELVGPTGSVIGIDRSPQALSIATRRARRYGLQQLAFHEAAADTFVDDTGFDLVVGRYVLIHQSNPAAFLRAAARLVKSGGAVAFHEIRLRDGCHSVPHVPLLHLIDTLLRLAFSTALPHYDAGDRLIQHFSDAGLPEPDLFCETQIWASADGPQYGWMVDTLRSLLPQLRRLGIVIEDFMNLATLERTIRKEISVARSQVAGPPQICAWAKIPA